MWFRSANSSCASSVCVDTPAIRDAPSAAELRRVVAETARLRGAAARARDVVPARDGSVAGQTGAGVDVQHVELRHRSAVDRPCVESSVTCGRSAPVRWSAPPSSSGAGRSGRQRVGVVVRHAGKASLSDVIDLRSDTQTKPSPAMREAMATAEVGDEQRARGPDRARARAAKAAALARAGGGGLPADRDDGEPDRARDPRRARHRADRRGDGAHHDLRARRRGLARRAADARAAGLPRPHLAASRCAPRCGHGRLLHTPRASVVALENTHNTPAGRSGRSRSCASASRRRGSSGCAVHLDGARLANAAVASGVPAFGIGGLFDTVTLCLSKGLGCPLGARDRRLARADGAGAGREAPLRRSDAPGRDRGGGRRVRARAQRRAARGRSRARPPARRGVGGAGRAGRPRRSSRRTSCSSTSARSG